MQSLVNNGDFLAQEFAKLMAKPLGKIASVSEESKAVDETGYADDSADSGDYSEADDADYNDADIADLLVEPSEETSSDAEDPLNGSIEDMKSYSSHSEKFSSKRGTNIMHGLGKITASLRAKGESFAADVVEATALSIREDLVKEAAVKNQLNSALTKIASKLQNSGDTFAADLVRATINKIA